MNFHGPSTKDCTQRGAPGRFSLHRGQLQPAALQPDGEPAGRALPGAGTGASAGAFAPRGRFSSPTDWIDNGKSFRLFATWKIMKIRITSKRLFVWWTTKDHDFIGQNGGFELLVTSPELDLTSETNWGLSGKILGF